MVPAFAGIGLGYVVAHRFLRPARIGILVLVIVVAAKLMIGIWYWHTFLYSLEDQSPRPAFVAHEIYDERRSDTAVVDDLLDRFEQRGIQYFGSSDDALMINRAGPAHLAALVIRPFGGTYASYFPFITMLTVIGSLALIVALYMAGARGRDLQWGALLMLFWPIGMDVANVYKDSALVGVLALTGAAFSTSKGRLIPGLLGLATSLTLPLFRPFYAAAWGGTMAVHLTSLRRLRGIRLALLMGAVAAAAFVATATSLQDEVLRAATSPRVEANLLRVPVLGRILYGLFTPFPWTDVLDGWWLYTRIQFFPMHVLLLASILSVRRIDLMTLRRSSLDAGAMLGMFVMTTGLVSPVIQPTYISVGLQPMMPFLLAHFGPRFWPSVKYAIGLLILGNAFWVLFRHLG
jgi:hypothetical protein